jgi:quercetin dioxygenase-like cupin family protein
MKLKIGTFVTALALGTVLGVIGTRVLSAHQESENRTMLLTADLIGIEGYEVRMWLTDIGPGVVGAKHYHPGTECVYILEGALNLEEGQNEAHLNHWSPRSQCWRFV